MVGGHEVRLALGQAQPVEDEAGDDEPDGCDEQGGGDAECLGDGAQARLPAVIAPLNTVR